MPSSLMSASGPLRPGTTPSSSWTAPSRYGRRAQRGGAGRGARQSPSDGPTAPTGRGQTRRPRAREDGTHSAGPARRQQVGQGTSHGLGARLDRLSAGPLSAHLPRLLWGLGRHRHREQGSACPGLHTLPEPRASPGMGQREWSPLLPRGCPTRGQGRQGGAATGACGTLGHVDRGWGPTGQAPQPDALSLHISHGLRPLWAATPLGPQPACPAEKQQLIRARFRLLSASGQGWCVVPWAGEGTQGLAPPAPTLPCGRKPGFQRTFQREPPTPNPRRATQPQRLRWD